MKKADLIALATERHDLMPEHPGAWDCLHGIQPMEDAIIPMPAEYASTAYFSQLMALMQSDHRRRHAA